ncbi:hypothetical protein BOC40_06685 [Burkholderia pseudomallei]|nr:hypothetical protein BOC40_06685 [Burkholderia pseudomallei]ARL46271.1 hypothetical protein BOC50_25215 [Burkholderia pseudomallei]
MFSLKNALMARRIRTERNNTFERLFGLGAKALRQTYCDSGSRSLRQPDIAYPAVQNLAEVGINAFFAQFQVRESDAAPLAQAATHGYEPAGGAAYSKVTGGAHFRIHLSRTPKFAGVVVSLVSDDVEVFHRIAEHRIPPPAPWTVFTHLDPLELGPLQGDVAYWWRQFWRPFWNSLSATERGVYLISNNASADWAACVRFHST